MPEKTDYTIIQALPGWWVLEFLDGGGDYVLTPVVAWRVETDKLERGCLFSMAIAVTADLMGDTIQFLVTPAGTVIRPAVMNWDTIEDCVEWWKQELAKPPRLQPVK